MKIILGFADPETPAWVSEFRVKKNVNTTNRVILIGMNNFMTDFYNGIMIRVS